MKMNKGVTAWTISLSKYVNEAVNNSEKWIQENMPENKHSSRATNPFPTDYHPDLDTTNDLDEDQATYYQPHIGILPWIVELGHLQTVFHIHAYLKKRHNSKLALDPSHPEIDMRVFHQADWTDSYGGVKEAIPDNAPEPTGNPIILRALVDSDHANGKGRRRSQTGFCFFINMACIICYIK